jgi:hypothetical protein
MYLPHGGFEHVLATVTLILGGVADVPKRLTDDCDDRWLSDL